MVIFRNSSIKGKLSEKLNLYRKKNDITKISKQLLTEMQKSDINGAVKLLTNNIENGTLLLNDNTLELFRQKHPKETDPEKHAILTDNSYRGYDRILYLKIKLYWRESRPAYLPNEDFV